MNVNTILTQNCGYTLYILTYLYRIEISYQVFCIVRVMNIGSVCRLAKPRTIEQVCKQQGDHVLDEDSWERILVANLLFALLASS